MEDDLKILQTMINEYVEGKLPLPYAFVFSVITPCRHDQKDHYDFEHCMASQDSEEGVECFDKLADYTEGAMEEYQSK